MSHHFVEFKNIHYTYPEGSLALKEVSIKISHGESVGIIGANGAGKSTLLHLLNGFLLATEGEIRIGEILLNKNTISEIRRRLGMVFQDPNDQLFMPTVFEDVAFGPLNLGLDSSELDDCVLAALKKVGSEHLIHKACYALSGGEKKRVAIATVLSMKPDILVMDEPTNGLDPYSRRQLISILKTFNYTKIIATHDLDLVLDVCDRVIVLNKGIVKAEGRPQDIFNNESLLSDCHLEKPLSKQGCTVCRTKEGI